MARTNRVCCDVDGTFTDCLVFEAVRDVYTAAVNRETFQLNEARIRVKMDRQ